MKKLVFTILIVVSLLSVVFSTAGAASKTATLDLIRYTAGKGVVLRFHYTGTFYKADLLNASITVNHNVYDMHCHKGDDNHIVCETPGQVVQYHGYSAAGQLAGIAFKTTIPALTHIHKD